MGWLRAKGLLWAAVVVTSVVLAGGCGGHKPPGVSPFVAKINLTPSGSTSLQAGGILTFAALAQNSSNGTVAATITWMSSDNSILNVAPNGVACAGHWDPSYANCTPGNTGLVSVTATASGTSSVPTLVFVHPPIDNITVTGVLLTGIPVQQPCLSQGQTMTVEAHAFSQGVDVTSSVGPFTWSTNSNAVVSVNPLRSEVVYNGATYNIATNQATAVAGTPGIAEIYASASGVTSTLFSQPPPGTDLSFFETCPIQNITLELGHAGSGQTSFVAAKGTAALETVVATITDVMGNSSLPNTNNGVMLSHIQLTWASSQPQVVGAAGCIETCNLNLPSAGAGAVTASCTPPSCNFGFPLAPAGSIPPVPVYATTAISGLVTGAASATSVLATSLGCENEAPVDCSTAIYDVSTARATPGAATPMPVALNSLLFDLGGDKAFVGSDFGAQILNPANVGTGGGAFSSIGTVTGKILAISTNGSSAIFSDTLHVPNQVYVVSSGAGPSTITALNISGATQAAFSRDGFDAFIFGFDSGGNPNLYVYSTLQALQTIPLPAGTSVDSILFSTNGAFAYLVESSAAGSANLTAVSVCNDQIGASVPLPAGPIQAQVLPGPHLEGTDSYGNSIPDGTHVLVMDAAGFDVVTSTSTAPPIGTLQNPGVLCPQTLSFASNDPKRLAQRINLGQGAIHPIAFFPSPDGTQLYVLASDRSAVLVYNLAGGAVSGIELAGNATPVSVDMAVDGGTIVVAGSDGLLHLVTFASGGSDQDQIAFPNLSNYLNPFCTFTPAAGACTLDLVAAKP